MSSLLFRFRQQYPQGSLRCDLLEIDRGLYLVQASVTINGIVLGTALAAQGTLEAAEDSARERVLALLNLSPSSVVEPPPPETLQTTAPIAKPPSSPPPTPATPSTVKPEPESPPPPIQQAPQTVTPPQETLTVETVPPVADLPKAPLTEPELPFTLQSEIYSPPDISDSDRQLAQNGTQTPLPVDANALVPDKTEVSIEPSLSFDQPDLTPTVTGEIIAGDHMDDSEDLIDFSEIIARSNLELKRLGWTSDQGRNYLLQTYGKRSRQLLSDEQLIEFLAYLEQQPTPE